MHATGYNAQMPDDAQHISRLKIELHGDWLNHYVRFFVDGVDLGLQTKAAFGEHGFDEILPLSDLMGEDTVIDEDVVRHGADRALLLACGCGISGCSSVDATVRVTESTITWSDFTKFHGGQRNIAQLEPVTFDRRQFEEEVRRVRDAIRWPRLHVVLVCHTELDFEGSWKLYDRIQPSMEAVFNRVADATGKRPRCTYCGTMDFFSEKLEDALRFKRQGDEVGVHSHLPGAHRPAHSYQGHYAYRYTGDGATNQDRVAGPIKQIADVLGMDAVTHVSGMFTFTKGMVGVLEDSGFTVDCSLIPGIGPTTHPASGKDFVLADNSRHPDARPYRPSRDDPWVEGDSRVLELPVSGNLGAGDLSKDLDRLRSRLEAVGDGVDIFQTYWHHFEFAGLGWTKGRIEEAERFLMEAAKMDGVAFSTAASAAWAFQEHLRRPLDR